MVGASAPPRALLIGASARLLAALRQEGYDAEAAPSPVAGLARLTQRAHDLVVVTPNAWQGVGRLIRALPGYRHVPVVRAERRRGSWCLAGTC